MSINKAFYCIHELLDMKHPKTVADITSRLKSEQLQWYDELDGYIDATEEQISTIKAALKKHLKYEGMNSQYQPIHEQNQYWQAWNNMKEPEYEDHPFNRAGWWGKDPAINTDNSPVLTNKTQTAITKETNSMLIMIFAMAIRKYGYNPDAKSNHAIKKIQEDIQSVGMNLSVETIKKYLDRAKNCL